MGGSAIGVGYPRSGSNVEAPGGFAGPLPADANPNGGRTFPLIGCAEETNSGAAVCWAVVEGMPCCPEPLGECNVSRPLHAIGPPPAAVALVFGSRYTIGGGAGALGGCVGHQFCATDALARGTAPMGCGAGPLGCAVGPLGCGAGPLG